MRYVIYPLEEDFKVIETRASSLEKFLSCPFKFKYAQDKYSSSEPLVFGNIVNSVIQSYLYDRDRWHEALDIHCQSHPDYCGVLWHYMGLIEEHYERYSPITNEMQMILEIEMWKYLVLLQCTMDLVCKNKETGKYVLADLKTSKAEWKPQTLINKVQRYIYTFAFSQIVGIENIESFDYVIFTKHVKPRLQILSYVPDIQELSQKMKMYLQAYVKSVESDIYEPLKMVEGNINSHCYFCPLKDKLCPAWNYDVNEQLF